jgi:hypothetical protein
MATSWRMALMGSGNLLLISESEDERELELEVEVWFGREGRWHGPLVMWGP